jgi:hypothetical protein
MPRQSAATTTPEEPSFLDEPWLRRQVENHLVFGFFARRVSFSWIIVALLLLSIVSTLASHGHSSPKEPRSIRAGGWT